MSGPCGFDADKNCISPAPIETDRRWVLYCNERYIPLLKICLRMLHAYSRWPTVLYLINVDKKIDVSLYNVAEQHLMESKEHIYVNKLEIILDTLQSKADDQSKPADFIYLDVDTLVNYSVDELWQFSHWVKDIALMSIHPSGTYAKRDFGLSHTLPYGHSNLIWYNKTCQRFFQECLTLMRSKPHGFYEEVVLNVVQNQFGMQKIVYHCTPYFTNMDKYMEQCPRIIDNNERDVDDVYMHLFHGIKNEVEAEELSTRLLKFNQDHPDARIRFVFVKNLAQGENK